MTKLTEKPRDLVNCLCPFCGSQEVEGSSFDFSTDSSTIFQESNCIHCRKNWIDEYTLTAQTDEEGEEIQ